MFKRFSKLGQAFMLPIAILPVAGLLLGLGAALTNESTVAMVPFLNQPWLQAILQVMNAAGNAVFSNLPLIFAIGIAVGLADADKGTAGLSAAVAFLVFTASIAGFLQIFSPDVAIDTGVLGALVIGLTVTYLHNRYRKIVLPQFLGFFGGNRFIPIISALSAIAIGAVFFIIWPPVQRGMVSVGNWIAGLGSIGSFFYGFLLRLTGAVGLHHTIYPLFWYTSLGGSQEVAGKLVEGAQNIYFAQLADPNHVGLFTYGTRFFAGRFATMMFGLPAACLGMYHAIPKKNRKTEKGFYFSSALTSFLTGITEPIEFSFLFAAPWLYVVHAFLDGVSFFVADILNIRIGNTFSGGLIDFTLFGPMQGNANTNWILVIPIGLLWAAVYYFIFRTLVSKFKVAVPGMIDEEDQAQSTVRVSRNTSLTEKANLIITALGGPESIEHVTACATRLRVSLKNTDKLDKGLLKSCGATAVLDVQNGVQAIFGGQSNVYSAEINEILSANAYQAPEGVLLSTDEKTDSTATGSGDNNETHGLADLIHENVEGNEEILLSPIKGIAVDLSEVKDDAFSTGVLGKGIAIIPEDGLVVSPVSATVASVFPTKHALGLVSDGGAEILIHMGLETVQLEGKGFEVFVKDGDKVSAGDKLAKIDLEELKKAGYDIITPVVITNSDEYKSIEALASGAVKGGDQLLKIKK